MSRYEWPATAGGERTDERDARRDAQADLGQISAQAQITEAPATAPGGRRRPQAAPNASANLWQPLGPTSMLKGHPADDGRVTGRVIDVVAHPADGKRVYAASAAGGIWFSADSGSTWKALGGWSTVSVTLAAEKASLLTAGALHVEFGPATNGNDDTVWVGSGEGFGGGFRGIGVLKATGPALKPATDPAVFTVEATNLLDHTCFRFAREPDGSGMVVATTKGLRERPSGAGPHAMWPEAAGHPMKPDSEPYLCVDTLWTPAVSGKPKRLWAIFIDDAQLVDVQYRDVGTSLWQTVALTDEPAGITVLPKDRAVFAASQDGSLIYVLGDGSRVWRVDTTAVVPEGFLVANTPKLWDGDKLNTTKIAIAVDPTNKDRVALGGTLRPSQHLAAALYCGVITAPSPKKFRYPTEAASHCGNFVHPDVLRIRFGDDGKTVWIACDGGVYRSQTGATADTFVAKNDGLAVAECGFIACHPTNDALVVVGTQDNGTQRRVAEAAFITATSGDGGGIAFDLANPHRYVAQYTNADWSQGPEPVGAPIHRGDKKRWAAEEAAARFYSQPSTILKNPTTTQVAIGSNRVWYTQDWGKNWVTLPTGKDPRDPKKKVNNTQDVLTSKDSKVRQCLWETPDRLWALTNDALWRYERGNDGKWSQSAQSVHPLLSRQGKSDTTVGDTPTNGPTATSGTWTDLAIHTVGTLPGKLATLYMATSGDATVQDSDQLWWFDGVDTWRGVGLRSITTAAALAVAVEPAHPEFVYVGTTLGVFRAHLEMDGATPEWTWQRLNNGLPDVAVRDLSLFSRGEVRLLRAATLSRGIWELDLAGPVSARTFVRVSDLDSRRSLPTSLIDPLVAKSPSKADKTQLVDVLNPWHASPDVRAHAKLAVVAAPASLPWTRAKHPQPKDPVGVWRLWQFQSALRSLDARSEPNGTWPTRFDDTLERAGAPKVGGKRAIDVTLWNKVMTLANVATLPWDAARPSEADLLEWLPSIDDSRPLDVPSTSVPAGPLTVQVMVHHRGFPAAAPSAVKVSLLFREVGAWKGKPASDWATGNVGWASAITNLLKNGTDPGLLSGGWALATTSAAATPAADVEAGSPQAVSFDIDLSAAAKDALVLLVAVVHSTNDPVALTEAPLQSLTLNDPHVAVRSLRVVATA